MHMTTPHTSDVLIIGAGPTGLTLALELARHGLHSCIIEQRAGPQRHPAACILNTRTMEIFRGLDLADKIYRQAQDVFDRSNITWVTALSQRKLGVLSVTSSGLDQVLACSPTHALQFPQNRLEPILWKAAQDNPYISLRHGRSMTSYYEADDGVTAEVADECGSVREIHRARWLVGCDGANSTTRRLANISWEGDKIQAMISIHFRADLSAFVCEQPSILYWIFQPEIMGVLIAHWLPDEWVLMVPFFPPAESLTDYPAKRCRELIRRAVGCDIDMSLEHVGQWTMASQLASRFFQGTVYLAGDAAHTFPPTGGLGLNTGVQDAHNLAWKFAWVHKKLATGALLTTYEAERRPIAVVNRDFSVENFYRMDELLQPARLSLHGMTALQRIQNFPGFRWLPKGWRRSTLRAIFHWGLSRLAVLDEPSPRGEKVRTSFHQAIPGQRPHYQCLGLDLGFRYSSAAIVGGAPADSRERPPSTLHFEPTMIAGGRLPHAWVLADGKVQSTLDLTDASSFVLIVSKDRGGCWQDAIGQLGRPHPLPIRCQVVSHAAIVPNEARSRTQRNAILNPSWDELCESNGADAVLVRPDGHIAWISKGSPANPGQVLKDVVAHLFGFSGTEPLAGINPLAHARSSGQT